MEEVGTTYWRNLGDIESAETWLERFDGADSDKVGESGGMIAV